VPSPTRTFAAVAIAVVALVSSSVPAGAVQSIGPHQHFAGVVDGHRRSAVVYTACAGPAWPGRTGPVVSGQTFGVTRARRGHGYTGPFTQIYAWFVPPSGGTTATPTQLTFDSYRVSQPIPTSVQVPCDGTGTVEFSSCPYLAPCAYGWIPDYVDVLFVDIAA
jgi:hypothetical protein